MIIINKANKLELSEKQNNPLKEKIAFLIPSTSKNKDDWETMKDTYLYKLTLKSFLYTQDKEFDYVFYIGYDKNDRIYANEVEQDTIKKFEKVFKNVSFQFISMEGIKKGHLTVMWNRLFEKSYNDNCTYFFQCGDDIKFQTKNWIKNCINTLKSHQNIGLTGPINNNNRILTQCMVSRKHMEIFGYFFPPEIINWCCDDWYNIVYSPDDFYPLSNHYCSNEGGEPRYNINNDTNFLKNQQVFQEKLKSLREFTEKLAVDQRKKIKDFKNIKQKKYCSLGTLCHSSQILKDMSLKDCSYPFDWIFSGLDKVMHCIEDKFTSFLDKSQYIHISNKQCGHTYYNNRMFWHHNPLKNEKDYQYFSRCVERFKNLLSCENPKRFLITLVNKKEEDIQVEKEKIIKFEKDFSKYCKNYKILAIFHIANKKTQTHFIEKQDNIDFVKLYTLSESDGIRFRDSSDNKYVYNLVNENT